MKFDKFTIFACYSIKEQELLEKYISPDCENSSFKGIPMSLYNKVTRLLPMKNRRLRFRGNSKYGYTRPRDFCHKEFAKTFAVYYDNNTTLNLGDPRYGWGATIWTNHGK